MKKVLLTLMLLFFVKTLFCQQELTTKNHRLIFGFNSCISLSPYDYDISGDYLFFNPFSKFWGPFIEFSPSIQITNKKHSIIAGPKFWIENNYAADNWKRKGINITYRYNFCDSTNRFNYNLFYDFVYSKFERTEQLSSYYNIPYSSTLTRSREHINNIIGIGISYSLFKNFTIGSEIGIGSHLFRRNEKLVVPDHSDYSFDSKGNYLSYGEVTSILRLYVTYNFLKI
jgi:hypothetical protein